jgi:hypothetical protein
VTSTPTLELRVSTVSALDEPVFCTTSAVILPALELVVFCNLTSPVLPTLNRVVEPPEDLTLRRLPAIVNDASWIVSPPWVLSRVIWGDGEIGELV